MADGGNCTICTEYFSVIHWHHTVPQSRGGKDSLQIPLCSSCHNILHANGVAIVARLRGSKRKIKSFWPDAGQEHRAQPYLAVLVRALMLPVADGYEAKHPIHLSVGTELYELLKLLQADIGSSSLEKTVTYAIKNTLSIRGLTNVKHSGKECEGKLWFLPSSER